MPRPAEGRELVEVAFVRERAEGEMIRGLLEGSGIPSILEGTGANGPQVGVTLLPYTGAQRVMVHAERAEEARALLAKALAENEEEAWPEIANAEYLEDAGGRKPRSYGLIGGLGRIYLWGFGTMAVAFGVFLLLRAL